MSVDKKCVYFSDNDRWKADEEFGREFLSGVNPVLVRRLNKPLDKFPVTEDMVGNLLDRGMSLKEEMEVGSQRTILAIVHGLPHSETCSQRIELVRRRSWVRVPWITFLVAK